MMEALTAFDAVAIVIVIVSTLMALARGFMREVMSIVGWIAAAVLAFMFAGQVEPLVKEIPVVGSFLTESCELAIIAAFAAVFALALVVVSIFTPLFAGLIRASSLGSVDSALGFLFGALRGVVLVAIALIVYEQVMVNDAIAMVEDSRSAQIFGSFSETLERQIPEDATGWVVERYEELVGDCGPGEGDAAASDANDTN